VALFCNVDPAAVIQSIDVPSIYEVPLKMHQQHLDEIVLTKTGLPINGEPHLEPWLNFLHRMKNATKTVRIGLVGKYVELPDAYKSINESLFQAATYNDRKLDLQYIHSEKLNSGNVDAMLSSLDGVLIAPGFGQRGIEGKFIALKYAREHDIPTFGVSPKRIVPPILVMLFCSSIKSITLCLVVTSISVELGAYDCILAEDSIAAKAYGTTHIRERHRHRFEFNNEYRKAFEDAGMRCVGENPETHLVEVVEVPSLRWYVGAQYHPEYNSTVLNPNPLFVDFIKAAISKK